MVELPFSNKEELKALIAETWGQRAAYFDEGDSFVSRTPELAAGWRDVFIEAFGPPPRNVLDVGSGTGELATLFTSIGYQARGIDLADGMLKVAREKNRRNGTDITFEKGDAESPPFPDASFDVVHARHILQLLPDPERALEEWIRIVRPGGVVFVTLTKSTDVPEPPLGRLRTILGRGFLKSFHAVGIDRRPLPRGPKEYKAYSKDHLPFRSGLSMEELREKLSSVGLVDIVVKDLLALRLKGRSAMVWYRRWANRPKQAYYAAWGRKPS